MHWLICMPNFKLVGPAVHAFANKWTNIGSSRSAKYVLQSFYSFALSKNDWMISDGNWSPNNNLLLKTLISYNAMA